MGQTFSQADENDTSFTRKYRQEKQGYTPTFLLIANDLTSPQDKIFEAAVYYLCVIAKFKTEYRHDIFEILNGYLKNNLKQTKRINYIQKVLNQYELD